MTPTPASDPVSQIILGVISNGIYDFGRGLFERVDASGPINIDGARGSATDLAIEHAVEQLTEVEEIRDEIGGERLREFLRSPELTQFGRQVFAFRINTASFTPERSNHEDPVTDMESLERTFVRSLQLWTGLTDKAADEHGGRLFAAFLKACDDGLSRLVDKGILAAHDAYSAMNTQRVLSELTNLKQNLELQLQPGMDVSAVLDFERRYRDQVADRDTVISLPSLDRRVNFHVDRLYVKPTLNGTGRHRSSLPYDDLLPLEDAIVVLGDPGGGKSTLVSKLIHDISSGRGGEARTPILVVLRDYAAQKTATGCSLIQYMQAKAESRYQIPEVPRGAFEYLLRNRRTMVLFDGLDELLDTSARREIAGDVESFRSLFPTTPVLVTSRKVGYEEAPLRGDRFTLLELGELDESQVEEYARRMLELHSSVSPKRRESLCADFMFKSSTLVDLRANPLLLGLLLERYTKTLNLPGHRVAVIESCALLLFERWDSDRGIFVKFPFESKLKPAVSHLAHQIYTDIRLPQGATERWLVAATVKFLVGRKYEDPAEAATEAQEFVDLCNGRTWVFSAAGLNSEGEELFKFTHRTFMEYFVAAYLIRSLPEPDRLLPFIRPRVEAQEWDEVCQLAVHMLARDRENGADIVLEGLMPSSGEVIHDELNQVVFCARALASLVPDRLETIDSFVRTWLSALELAATGMTSSGSRKPLLRLLDAFVNSHPENQTTLSRKFPRVFSEVLPGQHTPVRMGWLLNVAVNLPRLLRPRAGEAAHEVWAAASEEVAAGCREQLGEIAQDDFSAQCNRLFHDQIPLDEFLAAHGVGGLLAERPLDAILGDPLARDVLPSLAESMIMAACNGGTSKPRIRERRWALNILDRLGKAFPAMIPIHGKPHTRWDLPTFSDASRPRRFPSWLGDPVLSAAAKEWTPEQLFATGCLLLALDEQCHGTPPRDLGEADEGLLGLVACFIANRNFDAGRREQGPLLGMLGEEQVGHLRRWAGGEFSFTR